MYGQTEATARMAYLPPDLAATAPGTHRRAGPGRLVHLEPLPERRSPARPTRGRRARLPRAQRDARATPRRRPTWPLGRDVAELRTGDVARRADDGLYEIVGRRSRFAKVFGLRIDLDQVEQVLAAAGRRGRGRRRRRPAGPGRRPAAPRRSTPTRRAAAGRVSELGLPPAGVRAGPRARGAAAADRQARLPRRRRARGAHRARRRRRAPALDRRRRGRTVASPLRTAEVLRPARRRPRPTRSSASGGDSLSYVEMSLRLEAGCSATCRPAGRSDAGSRELARRAAERRRPRPPRRDQRRCCGRSAIVMIVGTHANLFVLAGGAHVLLGVAGFNFGPLPPRPTRPRRERVRHVARSVARVAVPSVLVIGSPSSACWTHGLRLAPALLLNGVLGPRAGPSPVALLVHRGAGLHAVLALTAAARDPVGRPAGARRWPFWLAVRARRGSALLTRYDVVGVVGGDEIHRAHVVFWLFALGWATAKATAVVAAAAGLAPWSSHRAGLLRRPAPRGGRGRRAAAAGLGAARSGCRVRAARRSGVLAAASLYIYLAHWQVYPRLEDAFPLLATALGLGIGSAQVAGRRAGRARLGRRRPRGRRVATGHAAARRQVTTSARNEIVARRWLSTADDVPDPRMEVRRAYDGRVAMISLHTSPLDQPGTGDAGGMNVYVIELARRLRPARHRGRDLHPRHLLARCRRSSRPADGVLRPPRRTPARSRGWPRASCPASCARSPARCCAPRPATPPATTTSSTPTTGSPARSARWPATAGACRSCTRCTPWPRSRTPRSPRATPPSRRPG